MPVKWKLFRVANYLQLVVTTIILVLFAYSFLSYSRGAGFDYFLLLCLGLLVIIMNNCFNIHIMAKHFPGTRLPDSKKTPFWILFIPYALISTALVILSVYLLIEAIEEKPGELRYWDWLGCAILALEALAGIYIMILQSTLPYLLEKNDDQNIQQLMDEIGQPEQRGF